MTLEEIKEDLENMKYKTSDEDLAYSYTKIIHQIEVLMEYQKDKNDD